MVPQSVTFNTIANFLERYTLTYICQIKHRKLKASMSFAYYASLIIETVITPLSSILRKSKHTTQTQTDSQSFYPP